MKKFKQFEVADIDSYMILLDFDGTCVAHKMPGIGQNIGAISVLRELVQAGHRLILFTMRSNMDRGIFKGMSGLDEAVAWFKEWDIPLYGIQTNPTQKSWTDSPKAFGDLIIDDTCLGIPTKINTKISSKPYVDWEATRLLLVRKGLLRR